MDDPWNAVGAVPQFNCDYNGVFCTGYPVLCVYPKTPGISLQYLAVL